MDGQSKAKRGCLGCAGIGCAVYIVLSVVSLLFYLLALDTPIDAVKKCSFRQIVKMQYMDNSGNLPTGLDTFLSSVEEAGVDVDRKLRKVIASKEAISDVKYVAKDYAPGVKLVTVSMRIKGAAHGEESVEVAMTFLVKPKSVVNFELTVFMGLLDITASHKGRARHLSVEMPIPGHEASTAPGSGMFFLGSLFSDDGSRVADFADQFIAESEAKPPSAAEGEADEKR